MEYFRWKLKDTMSSSFNLESVWFDRIGLDILMYMYDDGVRSVPM